MPSCPSYFFNGLPLLSSGSTFHIFGFTGVVRINPCSASVQFLWFSDFYLPVLGYIYTHMCLPKNMVHNWITWLVFILPIVWWPEFGVNPCHIVCIPVIFPRRSSRKWLVPNWDGEISWDRIIYSYPLLHPIISILVHMDIPTGNKYPSISVCICGICIYMCLSTSRWFLVYMWRFPEMGVLPTPF